MKITLGHAVGKNQIDDLAVVIAVSGVHHDADCKAWHFEIGTLKQTVPLWKKKYFMIGKCGWRPIRELA